MTLDPTPSASPTNDATESFVSLLMEHRHRIYAFITKQLVHAADVEDVFQRTSVVLWKKMADYDPTRSFFHWACGIAFNEIRSFRRTTMRSRLHFDADLMGLLAEEATKEEELSQARLEALRVCMRRLNERQQRLIALCYAGASSITEVAAGLGRTRGALYKQLERLRGKLLDCIRGRLAREGWGA